MKIAGCVALVTGANRGLGLAFAQALLDAGARKVYAAARDPSRLALERATPLELDITRPAAVAAAAQAARAALETNFFGTLAMARAFAPVLKANGGGAIVNMLSVLSWLNLPAAGSYGASKAAAWALTNGLRNELRAQGTLVVAVHAAFIDTDMAKGVQAPKSSPMAVARQALAAVEQGLEEVLADDITRGVKVGLSAERASYLRAPA
jgi:NAD(P)-dependent dehydrogenase (short-subunit alcohol dehydrogenase family)